MVKEEREEVEERGANVEKGEKERARRREKRVRGQGIEGRE